MRAQTNKTNKTNQTNQTEESTVGPTPARES
jgi:hypothetical protein